MTQSRVVLCATRCGTGEAESLPAGEDEKMLAAVAAKILLCQRGPALENGEER